MAYGGGSLEDLRPGPLPANDPAKIEEYKRYHQDVWPEITAGLRDVGVQAMKIYLLGNRLFMYLQTDDGFDLEQGLPPRQRLPSRPRVAAPHGRASGARPRGSPRRVVGQTWKRSST